MTARIGSRLRRTAPWVLALIVLALIGRQARTLDWSAVFEAVRAQSPARFAVAALVAAASHALYSSFDLVGRRLVGHRLSTPRTLLTAAISYAFNLNFGALVGGMAMRLRMYTRLGLDTATVTEVIALSLLTNWLGYVLVGGAVLLATPPPLPPDWPVAAAGARVIGATLVLLGLAYLAACRYSHRRTLRWREFSVTLPPLRIALLQAALSATNWLLICAILWILLDGRIAYPTVLAVLLLASMAGVLTHVPAGLGVTEAVFLAVLGGVVAAPQLLAALLAYRVAYHLLPLAWAVPAWAIGEWPARRGRGSCPRPRPPTRPVSRSYM